MDISAHASNTKEQHYVIYRKSIRVASCLYLVISESRRLSADSLKTIYYIILVALSSRLAEYKLISMFNKWTYVITEK